MLRRLFFPADRSSIAVRYGFALCAFTLVFLIRLLVEPELHDHAPLLLFTLAVVASAVRAGLGPGLTATALGAVGGLYFFPPAYSFSIEPAFLKTALFQLALFLVAGGAMSWLGGEVRKRRWEAEDHSRQRKEIIESITDGFAAFDAQGCLLYVNRGAERLTGKSLTELHSNTIWNLSPAAEGARLTGWIRQVLEQRIPLDFELFWEPAGRWLEFHAYPTRNGGFTLHFSDVTERKASEERLRTTLAERDAALEKVRVLTGLLPICAACKKIRDSSGDWHPIESYISKHSEARFSHGMCPECAEKLYPGFVKH